jgi:succinate-acetate transporter protein
MVCSFVVLCVIEKTAAEFQRMFVVKLIIFYGGLVAQAPQLNKKEI